MDLRQSVGVRGWPEWQRCSPSNQPQVAILGIGAIEKRPIVVEDADGNDAIVIKVMSYFTYDHRLVDGADADRFMIDVKKVLEGDSWSELEAYL